MRFLNDRSRPVVDGFFTPVVCAFLLHPTVYQKISWFRGQSAAIVARDSERADWDRKMSDFGKLQRTLVAR